MQVPNHIAVILDGNRRWAHGHNVPAWEGHRAGSKNFDRFVDWCLELNIPQISVYALSTENLNRPLRELKGIYTVIKETLERWLKSDIFEKYEIRVNFLGNLRSLPKKVVELMKRLMERTKNFRKKIINLLIGYGGHSELIEAFKKMAERILKSGKITITKKGIEENLLVQTPVDLIIRTGGMARLSNLLPWQSTYAEIFVTKTLWPDFSKKELVKAIGWYNSVQKNFGK